MIGKTGPSDSRAGVHIYIIYNPNLGFAVTDFVLRRECGRFGGSSEGACTEDPALVARVTHNLQSALKIKPSAKSYFVNHIVIKERNT